MATIRAFLKHTFVGKQSQAEPYTAAAHARYVSRKNAASLIYSERMPKQYHAVQRFLNAHEDGLRKNGRVIDKFIISIPTDISAPDAAKALKRFGYRLGQGRTPFLFALHGFKTQNHHAHFIFIDRDIETGKRVFGTTLRDSSAAIKLEWETAANETFAELGYDVRVEVKQGYEVANDNEALEREDDVDTVEDTEPVSEDDMAERLPDNQLSMAGNDIRLIATTVLELNRLRDAQTRLEEARGRYESLARQRENAAIEAGAYQVQSLPILQSAKAAEERLSQHQRSNGKLKGVGFKLLGYELKTAARKEAEKALQEAETRKQQADYAERKRRDYDHTVEVLSAQASAAEREAYMLHNELLATYGNEKQIASVERDFTNSITKAVQSISPEAARAAYDDGELTPDEYRTFLEQSGDSVRLAAFEEELGQSENELSL